MRLRDYPRLLAFAGVTLAYAALLPLSNVVPMFGPGQITAMGLWMLGLFLFGLVWLALLIGAVFRLGWWGDTPERRRSRAQVILLLSGVVLFGVLACGWLDVRIARGLPRGAWAERFDGETWRARRGDAVGRLRMLGDLTRHVLPALTLGEASRLLGPDDGWGTGALSGRTSLVFVVGSNWIDDLLLEIEYTSGGQYVTHRVRST